MKIIGYILIDPKTKEPWTGRCTRTRRLRVYEKEGVARYQASTYGVEYTPVYLQETSCPAASS